MAHHWIAILLILIISTCDCQIAYPLTGWTQNTSPLMPEGEATLFTGYESSEDRIWLIGADDEIWTYNIQHNNFTDYGLLSITLGFVNSQCSVQWGNSIYFVDVGLLREFSFNTKQLTSFSSALQFPREAPCVAALYPDYIYALGGVEPTGQNLHSDYMQIYPASGSQIWYNGPPMNSGRSKHACIVHDDYLYVFGGVQVAQGGVWSLQPSSERIFIGDMANINSYVWSYIVYVANANTYFHRAVVDNLYNQIYLIGGRDECCVNGKASRAVQIYDTQQQEMILLKGANVMEELNTGRSSPGVILVNNKIYVFGGSSTDGLVKFDTFEISNVLTFSPTASVSPTVNTYDPSVSPTKAPTKIPTEIPTKISTNIPTKIPTKIPSKMPTKITTNIPTNIPTRTPTKIPTNIPTKIPSKIPSKIPTKIPSKIPTNIPTNMRSKIPTKTALKPTLNVPVTRDTQIDTTRVFHHGQVDDVTTTSHSRIQSNDNSDTEYFNNNYIIIVLSALCILLCMVIFSFCIWRIVKKKSENKTRGAITNGIIIHNIGQIGDVSPTIDSKITVVSESTNAYNMDMFAEKEGNNVDNVQLQTTELDEHDNNILRDADTMHITPQGPMAPITPINSPVIMMDESNYVFHNNDANTGEFGETFQDNISAMHMDKSFQSEEDITIGNVNQKQTMGYDDDDDDCMLNLGSDEFVIE